MADSQAENLLKVVLPEEWKRFFAETGYAPTTAQENRCNSRLRVRAEVPVWFHSTPDGMGDSIVRALGTPEKALMKDISRTGIAILYHEQVFPEERLCIQFQNRLFEVTVVRCRRISKACYEVGSVIDSLTSLDSEDHA